MEKADEMILLSTLYNRIKEQISNKEKRNEIFMQKCQKLFSEREVSKQSISDAFVFFIPEKRKEYINNIKEEAIEEYKKEVSKQTSKERGFSKGVDADSIDALIDRILDDDIVINPPSTPKTERNEDPCSRPIFHRSSC